MSRALSSDKLVTGVLGGTSRILGDLSWLSKTGWTRSLPEPYKCKCEWDGIELSQWLRGRKKERLVAPSSGGGKRMLAYLDRVTYALVGADRVVRVDATHALVVQAGTQVEGVVGEEALIVQGVAKHLSHRGAAHGPLVGVLVVDRPVRQNFLELSPVPVEPCASNHASIVHLEHHRLVARQDGKPG